VKSKHHAILRGEPAHNLPGAEFQPFERRPVNYYRHMFSDEDLGNGGDFGSGDANGRLVEALAAERARLEREHGDKLRRDRETALKQGRAEAEKDLQRAFELAAEYARVLQAEKDELASRAEQSSIELAFMLARKIIDQELETRPETVVDVARNAVRQVLDCDQVRLRVNPDDLQYLQTAQSDLSALMGNSTRLEVRADNSLKKGDCMIETERGVLDARIASQLDTLRATARSQTGS